MSSRSRLVCLLLFGLLVASARADDPQWTLATADTSLTLSVSSNRLLVTSLMNPAQGWNWIAAPTGFPLVASANALPLTWQYTNATYSTTDGQKLTLRFECASPALALISEWWARPGRGPVRHAMTITNMSGSTATISYQPSLYLPVAGDGQLSTWYIHTDGGTPDAIGVYNDTVSGSYNKQLETRSEGLFIPFAALTVTNGHGVYVGTEWSAARTYIQGGSTTNALLEATGYQEGRGFTYALANNATFVVPPAFVGAYAGDRDEAGNGLRKYLRDYCMPDVVRTNSSYPKVQWNAFGATGDAPGGWNCQEKKFYPLVDDMAPLGFEEVMIDVGWWAGGTQAPEPDFDPVDWSSGMAEAAAHAHEAGLRFGLYWNKGEDMATDEGRNRRLAHIKRLYEEHHADIWRSDNTAGPVVGDTYDQVKGFYALLDQMAIEIPNFQWENCSSGGRIKDFGAMKHAVKIFITDTYAEHHVRQAFYDSSFVLPPAQLEGCLGSIDGSYRPQGAAGMRFAFRTMSMGAPEWFIDAPNGGNGSAPWTDEEKAAVKTAVGIYKAKIRPLVRNGDLYHILPRPDGGNWDGVQYYDPAAKQGVVIIFRPDSPSASQHLTLKGLNAAADYVLTFADGSNPTTIRSGTALMGTGLDVTLAARTNSEWMFIAEGVTLTQPAEGTVFNVPATIPLEAVATPTNGSISQVEFYAGSNSLQTVTTASSGTVYSCVWSNVTSGSYLLTAKVYTNGAPSSISASVGVRVNALPLANSNDYTTLKNVILNVAAPGVLGNDSDPDGDALTAVLTGCPLHGNVTLNADGSFIYTPTNNYSGPDAFTYRATDGWATSAAATVAIAVTSTNYPPTAAITSPLLGAGTGLIPLEAAATDGDGSVTNVAFYVGGAKVGETALPPFACIWTNGSPGAYTLRAVATDNDGLSITSTPVTIEVVDFTSWSRRLSIAFSGYNRVETLTNFPALVRFSTSISGFAWSQFADANGNELRFTDADGRILPYEFDSGTNAVWTNSAGVGLVWVRVSSLTSNTTLYAYWGNGVATEARPAYTTNGCTWDAVFAAVYHLATTGGDVSAADATRVNDGSVSGTVEVVTGQMAGGASFVNSGVHEIAIPDQASVRITSKLTFSAWVNQASRNENGALIIQKRHPTIHDGSSENYGMWVTGTGQLCFELQNPANGYQELYSGANAVPLGSWAYLTYAIDENAADGKKLRMYVNGSEVANFTAAAYANTMPAGCTAPIQMGNYGQYGGGVYQLNGSLDEVRLSPLTHSSNWVWACYQNMASNAVFNTYGAVQVASVPVAPTGLTATAAATNRIELVWSDNATNETGYLVEHSLDSNAWVLVVLTSANTTNASDIELTTNTLYYYRVAATNAAGLSGYCYSSVMTWSAYEVWRHESFTTDQLTNSAISGEDADPDSDRMSNLEEYQAGTNPTNPLSVLCLTDTSFHAPSSEFVIRWQSVSDHWYTVQATTNLLLGFVPMDGASNIEFTLPENVYTDDTATAVQKFYRVKVE